LCDTDNYGIFVPDEKSETAACIVGLYGRRPEHARFGHNVIMDGAQHWLVANGAVGKGMAISFDPTKNLPSSGNGGAIVTNELGLYNFAIAYRSNDMEEHWGIGTNSKMSEQDCAQILVRTRYIDAWQKRRADIARYWIDRFKNLPIKCLCDVGWVHVDSHAYQKFVIYTENRNALHTNLLLDGIESKIHYGYTLGELPVAQRLKIVKPDLMSVSIMLSRSVLSLPMYPELTDLETEYIADRVCMFYDK
jgi:dTDP-4-amino-4,6-dideoxygalactose transaminase